MIVDGEHGIAGDTKLFGKRLVAVEAGGFFRPPAKGYGSTSARRSGLAGTGGRQVEMN